MERIWKHKNEEFPFFLANPHSPLRSSMAGRWFFVVCLFFFCCFGCGRSTPCGQKKTTAEETEACGCVDFSRRMRRPDVRRRRPLTVKCRRRDARCRPTSAGGKKKKKQIRSQSTGQSRLRPPSTVIGPSRVGKRGRHWSLPTASPRPPSDGAGRARGLAVAMATRRRSRGIITAC